MLCEQCVFNDKCRMWKSYNSLQKKLDIAVKALKNYAEHTNWLDIEIYDVYFYSAQFKKDQGYKIAKKALEKIKEIK